MLDNNNRKPVCRLRFNHSTKYLGLLDAEKNEEKIALEKISDVYKHADRIRMAADYYSN